MARGGARTPRNPAPVSGPGAQSRRTDGGAGQPVRETSGGDYGERQALAQQQSAAPMAAGGGNGLRNPNGPPESPSPAAGPPGAGMFDPTQRPGESPLTGMMGPTPAVADPDMALRAMYRNFPHPAILKLIRQQTEG